MFLLTFQKKIAGRETGVLKMLAFCGSLRLCKIPEFINLVHGVRGQQFEQSSAQQFCLCDINWAKYAAGG